ncbi:hypothetical protein LRR18_10850 [Mangrovimonas sp. AS39]|uniref:hypothetical protein n=1 Tax=Mangrovimonas TaxID=1211036 RepID=UPI00141EAC61|nr:MULTISPECIES: hypothetical protein [Mangrovimonas]MCF1192082.1 hypothetical protein [Mangrovimonas futianensis]MCF1195776.1 hypothetical protein [Mangrovimonas futianensis]MCF1422261.1 hypothetical protein [Mangrovimonas futianensis]NIK92763.1 hypothetical protein [Mangrovimonas sp. CR14]
MSNVFESISENSSKATDLGEKYIKNTQDYIKLKVFQQLTISISMVVKMFIVGSLCFVGSLFLAAAAAWSIGKLLGSLALGCLVVAFLFFILGLIAYQFRQKINSVVITKMSEKFFN